MYQKITKKTITKIKLRISSTNLYELPLFLILLIYYS